MRKSGQITVFLSLILLCICSLLCGLIESARTAGAGWYLKMAADSAMDSVFSEYHREVWDQYRIFLLECDDRKEIENAWLEYMEPYMEDHGWYPVEITSAEAQQVTAITDDHGVHFKQEIQDYMKYGIWDTQAEEGKAETLGKQLKEASSLHVVSGAYSGHAREAARLERALEEINKSLEKQEEYRRQAAEALGRQQGGEFRSAANDLKREIRRLPSLGKTYEKRADELADHLTETRRNTGEQWEDLSDEVRTAVNGEIASYDSFLQENGEKRLEIMAALKRSAENPEIIDRAEARSREVEAEISEWEGEEDEDGPDEEALWGTVQDIWDSVEVPGLTFRTGIADPQKQNLLEQVQKLAELDLLALILPEGTQVSRGVIPTKGLPSLAHAGENILADSIVERVLTDEYIDHFFTCFLSEEKKNTAYEREYMLGGRSTDEENLKAAAAKILAVREGLNLIHILSDSQKRGEAWELAAAITGVAGAVPLTGIVAFFVMTVWALGESIADLKALLAGAQIPLIKTREDWRLDLSGLLNLGEQGHLAENEHHGEGMNYDGYLKLMLFMERAETLYYRIMDMIQVNIAANQQGFFMEHCMFQAKIRGSGQGKHIFPTGGNVHYSMEVITDKAY